MTPELVTAITGLMVALGGVLATVVTLIKVLETRSAVNGQADKLQAIASQTASSLVGLHSAVGTMQDVNQSAADAATVGNAKPA